MYDRQFSTPGSGLIRTCLLALMLLSRPAWSQDQDDLFVQQATAAIDVEQAITDLELGAVQGVVVRAGKIYAYGDVTKDSGRMGVIREYDFHLQTTGRFISLTQQGTPLIVHPTGLTWNDRYGTFLGDTVKKRALIYKLDWDQAWQDGNLDRAVLATLDDDAAINGCRPLLVQITGRMYLATADYGDVRPEIRLYDPDAFLAKGRSSAPGVVIHRVLCGPFNQNLYWDERDATLICVQNVIEGKGWRLDKLDLNKAITDGRVHGSGVRKEMLTFPFSDELEGYWPLDEQRALFAVARRRDNLVQATIRTRQNRSAN